MNRKIKVKNEKIKRKYFDYLKEAKGFSDKTVSAIEKALWKYEDFTKEADFAEFNKTKAKDFKTYLKTKKSKRSGKALSVRSQYHMLRHVRDFFTWLSGQAGYKRKVDPYEISYLEISKKDARLASQPKKVEYPTIEHVIKLVKSIKGDSEIDRRDRALFSFALLSGMRDDAIISLRLDCFDPETLEVKQDPDLGVRTKFGKNIDTVLFRFNDYLLKEVLGSYEYLKKEKLFVNAHPFFPKIEVGHGDDNSLSFKVLGVSKEFWSTTGSMRNIFRDRAAQAGLDYYSPHKFRHTAVAQALKFAETAEEIKAISQNFGHEYVATTMNSYANLSINRVNEIIKGMSFDRSKQDDEDITPEQMKKIKQILGK